MDTASMRLHLRLTTVEWLASFEQRPQQAYLSVINLACTEQRIKGVVTWDGESCNIYEEFASDIEEDQEEVNSG